jgi:site-specific DNA recombinase
MKVALYARVSTQRQAQTQNIDQQLERLQAYVQAQGWFVACEDVFRDDGYSGATLKRAGLDRLRDRVAASQLDRIIITNPDRLARNYVHQVLLVEELQQYGTQVEFLERPMSQDPHDQLLLQIRGAVAEYERTLISERMRRGRLSKLQTGQLLPWMFPPYGYGVDPDHPRDPAGVRVNPESAAIVREIFRGYVEEPCSLMVMAQRLQHMGAISPSGKERWNTSTLRSILSNRVYIGEVYANKYRTQAAQKRRSALQPLGSGESQVLRPPSEWLFVTHIPAIIEPEQFEAAQMQLQRNHQTAKRNNKSNDYLLRAMVSCGNCLRSCSGRCVSSGQLYYHCRTKTTLKELSDRASCKTRYIPAQQLDELVWNDLCAILQQSEMITQALERARNGDWLPQALQARGETLKHGQESLTKQLERLTEAYLAGIIPLQEYQQRRSELEARKQVFDTQAQQLAIDTARQVEVMQIASGIEEFCERIASSLAEASFERKRQLVELLIDRVVVVNEEVEIRYVIPTSSKGENKRFCQLRTNYLPSFW